MLVDSELIAQEVTREALARLGLPMTLDEIRRRYLGLRFEDFPLLLGWTQPFAQFERYLPISPGLL